MKNKYKEFALGLTLLCMVVRLFQNCSLKNTAKQAAHAISSNEAH